MKSRFFLAAAAIVMLAPVVAEAKPARCFTTDDGHYDCTFKSLDRNGSFEISARGYPTYSLWIDRPGVAAGFVQLGGRNVSLPGSFIRRSDDRACWQNNATQVVVCAW